MHRAVLALAAAWPLAACDGGMDLDGELSETEAAALAEVLFQNTWDNTESPQASASGPATVPQTFTQGISITGAPCPLGGTVDVDGSVAITTDTETTVMSLDMSQTLVHHDCRATAETSGQEFTLNGSPNMTTLLSMETDGADFLIDGSMVGSVQWETEGRAGICTVSVELVGSGSNLENTGSFSMSGTVCGVSIEMQTTVS